jgi:hypothetical protein
MPDVYSWIAIAIAAAAVILGAQLLGVSAVLVAVTVGGVMVAYVLFTSARRAAGRSARRDPRFEPTEEVFHDPASGAPTRVYVDPATGERRYWKDP